MADSDKLLVMIPEGVTIQLNGSMAMTLEEPAVVALDAAGRQHLERTLGTALPEVAKYGSGNASQLSYDEPSDSPPAFVQVAASLVHHLFDAKRSHGGGEAWQDNGTQELSPEESGLYDTALQRVQDWINQEAAANPNGF